MGLLLTPPAVGLHRAIPAVQYHQWDALNQSAIGDLVERSPSHFKYHRDNPREENDDFSIGTALHALVLQPDRYMEEVAIGEDRARRSNEDKRWWAEFEQRNAGKAIITPDQHMQVMAMAKSVVAHPLAYRWLADATERELSAVFKWPESETICKARIDLLRPKMRTIADLKTCRSAEKDKFMRSVHEYGYHRQAAWYMQACEVLGIEIKHFVFICVEKEPPYAVRVWRLDETAIYKGKDESDLAVTLYEQCKATGYWPGYPEIEEEINLPPYAFKPVA